MLIQDLSTLVTTQADETIVGGSSISSSSRASFGNGGFASRAATYKSTSRYTNTVGSTSVKFQDREIYTDVETFTW